MFNDLYAAANGISPAAGQLESAAKARYEKLTIRDNLEQQIARAKAEVERLEAIRDRMSSELLDQRIADLRQAMNL